jgi:hypothetical protein
VQKTFCKKGDWDKDGDCTEGAASAAIGSKVLERQPVTRHPVCLSIFLAFRHRTCPPSVHYVQATMPAKAGDHFRRWATAGCHRLVPARLAAPWTTLAQVPPLTVMQCAQPLLRCTLNTCFTGLCGFVGHVPRPSFWVQCQASTEPDMRTRMQARTQHACLAFLPQKASKLRREFPPHLQQELRLVARLPRVKVRFGLPLAPVLAPASAMRFPLCKAMPLYRPSKLCLCSDVTRRSDPSPLTPLCTEAIARFIVWLTGNAT